LALVTAVAVLTTISVADSSGGTTIAQSEAEIVALSSRLAHLSQSSETTANAYDNATAELAATARRINVLQGQLRSSRSALARASHDLATAVIHYYVMGPVTERLPPVFNQSATQQVARALYERLSLARMSRLRSNYERDRSSLEVTVGEVQRQRNQLRQRSIQIRALLVQNNLSVAESRATLATITHSLAAKIIVYEIQRGVQAAKRHDTAGEIQAVTTASSVGGQSAANTVTVAIQSAASAVVVTQIAPSAKVWPPCTTPRARSASRTSGVLGARVSDSTVRGWCSGRGARSESRFRALPRLSGRCSTTSRCYRYSPGTSCTTSTWTATISSTTL
jgi:hypothetical protein